MSFAQKCHLLVVAKAHLALNDNLLDLAGIHLDLEEVEEARAAMHRAEFHEEAASFRLMVINNS